MNAPYENKYKNTYKPLFFILLFSIICLVVLMNMNLDESQKTVPKIKLSYFKNNVEFVGAIEQRLHQEILQNKHIWIGVEPEKQNHLDFALKLKTEIEKKIGQFDKIIIDKELGLPHQIISMFGDTKDIAVKDNWSQLAEFIQQHQDKKLLIITAAIYSTNLIKQNPIDKVKSAVSGYKPMTFSAGRFALSLDDEKNNLFRCDTEDKTGVGEWGCAVINKARTVKRKVDLKKLKDNPGMILGLVDLTGQNDYMILIGADWSQTATQ